MFFFLYQYKIQSKGISGFRFKKNVTWLWQDLSHSSNCSVSNIDSEKMTASISKMIKESNHDWLKTIIFVCCTFLIFGFDNHDNRLYFNSYKSRTYFSTAAPWLNQEGKMSKLSSKATLPSRPHMPTPPLIEARKEMLSR